MNSIKTKIIQSNQFLLTILFYLHNVHYDSNNENVHMNVEGKVLWSMQITSTMRASE